MFAHPRRQHQESRCPAPHARRDPPRRRLPRLRHHAARRRPARGHHATRSPTSSPSPGCSTSSASASSRAAGPGAMPKDTEFFARAAAPSWTLRHAALVAFGATRKAGAASRATDPQVRALLDAQTPVVSPGRQVRRAARRAGAAHHAGGEPARWSPTRSRSCVGEGRRVFLDCEHFFDGFRVRPGLRRCGCWRPRSRRAPTSSCCATPTAACCRCGIAEVVARGAATAPAFRLGIHCQNDTACAVANTVAAVEAGATHVQCTANGYGERAGNADLFAVVGEPRDSSWAAGPTGRAAWTR